jgi:protein SCO1
MTNAVRIISACALLLAWPAAAPAQDRWGADYFPNVALTTQDGQVVRFYDDLIKGKTVAIDLIYTTCQYACPLETARLAQVQRVLGDRVGRDIFFYSITLKPEEDDPKALAEYAAMHHVGPGWLFLTGKPEDIELLRKKLGFTYADPAEDADKSNHVGMVRMGNEPYMRWAACPGMSAPTWIAKDILLELDGPTRSAVKTS